MKKLSWKQDGYLWFAHTPEGMYMIELRRRVYIVTLDLAGTRNATQDMGRYPSLAKAKSGAQRDHQALAKLK